MKKIISSLSIIVLVSSLVFLVQISPAFATGQFLLMPISGQLVQYLMTSLPRDYNILSAIK
ncbi:MAG: hypothetical protein ACYC6W_06925 [Nitrosotalea sp.]